MASRRPGRQFGVKPHLVPFLPYVEKCRDSALAEPWKWPSSRTHRIQIATLKGWLSSCDTIHGGRCHGIEAKDDGQWPVWLVDVRKQCIVPAEPGMTYAALSYVWGQVECFALGVATVERLTPERSLARARLPATIRDAMVLAFDLDLTYLWVDRLCIVQDDVAEKHSQLKAMADIYARAYVTIVAAEGGDASQRLARRPLGGPPSIWRSKPVLVLVERISKLLPSAPSRRATSSTAWSGPETDNDVMQIMAIDLLGSRWFSRGWTFQEYLFSSRKIVFHKNTVNWECRLVAAHEDQASLDTETPAGQQPPSLPGTSVAGIGLDQWPNFHRYARLVALFTLRSLTFPEDALDAFAGASAAISKVYPGGLVTGLPQMVFDAALLWQPYHPLTRRRAALIPPEDAILPSWSWVSWYGNVQSESWASGYDYLRRQPGHSTDLPVSASSRWSTFSTIQWSHSETLTSNRYPIDVGADQWRKRYSDPEVALPEGWTRDAGGDSSVVDSYFTHRNLSGYEFWYPILIPDQSSEKSRAARSRFLHCTTRHAYLKTLPKRHTSYGTACAISLLEDSGGEFVGVLRSNGPNEKSAALEVQTCHLIELSRGSVLLDADEELVDHPHASVFDEWHVPQWKHTTGLYEFYNVMEVEISNGIASRVAVGRVELSAWDRIVAEQIDVVLG